MRKMGLVTGLLAALIVVLAAAGALCGAAVSLARMEKTYSEDSRAAVMDAMSLTSQQEVTAYIGMDEAQQAELAAALAAQMAGEPERAVTAERLNEAERQHLRDVQGLVSLGSSVSKGCVSLAAAGGANASNLLNTAIFAGAMVGALMGFLRYNSNPARVFMGDVGSFFIGGALVGICVVTRLSLLLPIIALAMVMSSVSDIIQISYFKYTRIKTGTGKRVFRMAPLHYHFELGGMPETQVVAMYYIVTVVLCLIALLGFVG